MKKSEKKECPVPSMDLEPKVTGCGQNSTCVPTLDQIGQCLTGLMLEFIVSLNQKSPLSLKDEIDFLSEKRLNVKYVLNNFNLAVVNLLDNKIEHNLALIELKNQCKYNKKNTDSGEPFHQIIGHIKAVIDCGSLKFGMLIGSIVANLRNLNGDHIITIEATDLAKLVKGCCVKQVGGEFNNDTLAIGIGKGLKESSIIKEDKVKLILLADTKKLDLLDSGIAILTICMFVV